MEGRQVKLAISCSIWFHLRYRRLQWYFTLRSQLSYRPSYYTAGRRAACRLNELWLATDETVHGSRPITKGKGKGFPYSTPSVGSGADPGVKAVSLQVIVSHPPGGRLPLLSARPAVTAPAAEHHRSLAGTKLYCLVTEAHRCKQLA